MNLHLFTSDRTDPSFYIDGIRNSELMDEIRVEVESERRKKQVYEVD